MTTTDYLINGAFILLVLRQARERRLDARSVIAPLAMVFFVAQQYLHTIPTAGNDLLFIAVLASIGLTSGTISGLATHVRLGEDGIPVARIGWLAGALLVAGISSRMVFAFAVTHGLQPAVASFSIDHQITGAAWPVAMVLMALLEVAARIATVQIRGRRLAGSVVGGVAPAAV